MSSLSPHRPSYRFSYASSSPACSDARVGQSTFWASEEDDPRPNPSPCFTARQRATSWVRKPQNVRVPRSVAEVDEDVRGYFTEDEKRLVAIVGGGLIIALLIDAVAHSRTASLY